MYTGVVPVLTKGSFATFFGGQDVIQEIEKNNNVDSHPSYVIPLFFIISSLFQMLMYLYKRIRSSRLTNIHSYLSLLKKSLGRHYPWKLPPAAFNDFILSGERVEPVRPGGADNHLHSLLLRGRVSLRRHPGRGLQPASSGAGHFPTDSSHGVLCLVFADDCLYNSPLRKKSSFKVCI